ncbi:hypothetical protein SMD22_00500 (plasmid) [Brevibacillus halotolerans]|nr:hypothetical protein SMD22_00500 [Brevibacillus halotolerans]
MKMSEFATLTIQKKLEKGKKDEFYWNLYAAKIKGESFGNSIEKAQMDTSVFDTIRFVENKYGLFVEQVSNLQEESKTKQLRCEMDIPAEWLMCFSYPEMSVIGLDMGVFQAEAAVVEVIERLYWIEIENDSYDLFLKRDAILNWLRKNTKAEDRIHLCSNWIFYHQEGKYDYHFVRQFINNKIMALRQVVHCNHWSKSAVVRPEQMQTTA